MVISLVLIFLFGTGMDWLLTSSGREYFPVVALDIQQGVDRSYAGEYSGDTRFLAMLEEMPLIRAQALARAESRTGLTIENPEGFVLRFKDYSTASYFGASSQPVRAETGDVTLVTVSARQLMLGVMDVESSLVHEFIHGAMREKMGLRAYRALPKWIREGAAVWGAGQLREQARNVIAAAYLEKRDPDSVVHELLNLRQSADDYLSDAILFEYVDSIWGELAVRKIIQAIVSGRGHVEAFEDVCRVPWAMLDMLALKYSSVLFSKMVQDSGLALFQEARRQERWGDRQGAIERLLFLTEECADPLLKPNAWYWIGRWRQKQDRYESAAEAFARVLYDYPDQIGLQADSRMRLAQCLLETKDPEGARGELERFFKVHPDAPDWMRGDARFLLGRALFETAHYLDAAYLLQAATRQSPTFKEEAFYYLALSYLEAGEIFPCKLARSELAYRYPCSRFLPQLERRIRAVFLARL